MNGHILGVIFVVVFAANLPLTETQDQQLRRRTQPLGARDRVITTANSPCDWQHFQSCLTEFHERISVESKPIFHDIMTIYWSHYDYIQRINQYTGFTEMTRWMMQFVTCVGGEQKYTICASKEEYLQHYNDTRGAALWHRILTDFKFQSIDHRDMFANVYSCRYKTWEQLQSDLLDEALEKAETIQEWRRSFRSFHGSPALNFVQHMPGYRDQHHNQMCSAIGDFFVCQGRQVQALCNQLIPNDQCNQTIDSVVCHTHARYRNITSDPSCNYMVGAPLDQYCNRTVFNNTGASCNWQQLSSCLTTFGRKFDDHSPEPFHLTSAISLMRGYKAYIHKDNNTLANFQTAKRWMTQFVRCMGGEEKYTVCAKKEVFYVWASEEHIRMHNEWNRYWMDHAWEPILHLIHYETMEVPRVMRTLHNSGYIHEESVRTWDDCGALPASRTCQDVNAYVGCKMSLAKNANKNRRTKNVICRRHMLFFQIMHPDCSAEQLNYCSENY